MSILPRQVSPLIPPSANSNTSYCKTLQVSDMRTTNQVSFFGSVPAEQQAIYPTINSVILALQNYGLAAPGYTQEGGPLLGTGAVGNSYQGVTVSLSTDGNTLAVGGAFDDGFIGAVWIFIKTNGLWTQQGNKLVGTGAVGDSQQGYLINISSDGNTLAVGGPYDDSDIGATWIFTRTDGVWSQQGSKLVGTDAVGVANQGTAVALSADGNTLAVGGYKDNNYVGAVWIFTRTDEVWSQQGSKLVGTGATGVDPAQGWTVSLSGDGNTLAAGAYGDDNFIGATWIFVRTNETWSQQGPKLVGTGYVNIPVQGSSVYLRGDTLVVGGYVDNYSTGATWVFHRSGTGSTATWTQQGSKLVGTGYVDDAEQGSSVSLSDDEQTLITAGAWDNDGVGSVWVFKLIGGVWTQYNQKLFPTGYTGYPYFGYYQNGICISGDGSTIAIGGSDNNGNGGGTWVYVGF